MIFERPLSHGAAAAEVAAKSLERPLRLLIVRIGAMGDVLHVMPAVAALRERHPEWFLGWAIEPRWSELLESSAEFGGTVGYASRGPGKPLVDRLYRLPARRWGERPFAPSTLSEILTIRRLLRGEKFDLCVDMQGSIKSAVVGRMAGAKELVGAAEPRERQAAWLYGRRIPLHGEHVIEQGCELLSAALGETLQPAPVTLPEDAAAEQWCDAALADVATPFAMIAPAAGWGAKQWPAERFGAVAAALARAGVRTVVNAPSFGDALALKVVEASGEAAKLVPCSVGQMVALVRRAAVVIAGDTGPLHLAAALGRPVVALFGPTDPSRNGPWDTRAAVLRHASSRRNHKRLTETESGLMQITVGEVIEAALCLLRGGQDKVNG